MKRLILIALILTTPAFAQDATEEKGRAVVIRMDSLNEMDIQGTASAGEARIGIMESLGGGVEVAAGSGSVGVSLAAFADKSVWYFYTSNPTYCWVDDDNEPHCKKVKPE